MNRSRWILQALILSASLNVALVAIFFYFLIRDNPLTLTFAPPEKEVVKEQTLAIPQLAHLSAIPQDKLIEMLADERMVDAGYRVCDFALGALVSFHDLDLRRGLGRGQLAQRHVRHQGGTLILFPGLTVQDFDDLRIFIDRERWWMNTRGLFHLIQEQGIAESDPDLLHQFCRSSEFIVLTTLFSRSETQIQKGSLLRLVSEGGWDALEHFFEKEKKQADFSDQMRRQLLCDYLVAGSQTAAYLLLITDFDYAAHQLDDQHVCLLLDQLSVKTQEALNYVQTLANSPRGDAVHERVTAYIGTPTGVRQTLRPLFRDRPPSSPDPALHVIQPGESLWLIAQKYHVSIERLMQLNQLQSTVIQPGKTLKIPR